MRGCEEGKRRRNGVQMSAFDKEWPDQLGYAIATLILDELHVFDACDEWKGNAGGYTNSEWRVENGEWRTEHVGQCFLTP